MRERGPWRTVALAVAVAAVGVVLAWLVMGETPRGNLMGVVIAEELGIPIPDARVTLTPAHGRGSQLRIRTDAEGRFRFDDIVTGGWRLMASAQAHTMTGPRRVQVDEGATTRLRVELPPVEPFMSLSIANEVFTPDEEPRIRARGFTSLGALDVSIYRIRAAEMQQGRPTHLAGLLGMRDPSPDRWPLEGSDRLERVSRRTMPITGREAEGIFTMRLDLPGLKPGVYVVAVENEELQRIAVLNVTDLALVCKWSAQALLAWAVDIASGEPREGVQITAVADARPVGEGITGPDGLFALEIADAPDYGRVTVTARAGDAVATVETWSYGPREGDAHRVYCYTDRPAYRPGDQVHYKGVTRAVDGEAYSVPAGVPVQVQVRDDLDNLIHTANLRTGDFGSFDGTLQLPDAAIPGVYALKTSIAGEPHYSDFIVAEYRKPEWEVKVTTPRDRYVRGDEIEVTAEATYFYGAPVADASVEYHVTRSEQWYWPEADEWDWGDYDWYDDYGEGGEVVASGFGTTDSAGRLVFTVPTVMEEAEGDEGWRMPSDYSYRIEVEVTDPSRHSVSASHRVSVVQGEFRLQVEADPSILQVAETTQVTIKATDHDGDPVRASGEVRLDLTEWRGAQERFEAREHLAWATDEAGTTTVGFTPAEEGSYRVLATATDARGNAIAAGEWLWVTREAHFSYNYPYGELDLVADRRSYEEGDTARILVNTELAPVTALLTVESDTIRSHRLIELPATSTMVEVKLEPQWAPNCWIGVTFVRDKRFVMDELPVRIAPVSRKLEVTVASDREQYGPGEDAVFTVHATDPDGRAARAEVSLAVVDEALFALYPDRTRAIVDFFYPRRGHYVQTDFSFPTVYLDGADKGALAQIATRSRFVDTALWMPSAVTDASGEATFRFVMPDNLTTWRATARAHTLDTTVGEATHTALCTRPFLVRLAGPRFITQDDRLRLAAIVHNRTDGPLQADVGLRADLLDVSGGSQSGQVAPGEARRFEWEVSAPAVGDATVRVAAKSGEYEDAMQTTLPVHPRGRHRVEQRAGVVPSRQVESLPIRADAIAGASALTVRLTPSLAGAMLGSLDYLAAYPYGCIEQTTSAFLPDVIIARMLDRLHLDAPGLRERLPKMVQNGLLKIYGYQRSDGGWGWWGYDDAEPWMTAYVVFALHQARQAGYEVSAPVLGDGVGRLAELYVNTRSDDHERAWAAYVLALAGRADVVRRGRSGEGVKELIAAAERGPADVRALTCLALHAIGETVAARDLLDRLWRSAEQSEDIIHWEAGGSDYWRSPDSQTTALALTAVCRLTPDDPRLTRVARWLLVTRRGDHWYSTRDTAFVLYALAEYLPLTGEATPDFTATVEADGEQLLSRHFTRADVVRPEVVVRVPTEHLTPGSTVEVAIDREGAGRLYYTVELDQYVPEDLDRPLVSGTGITIQRSYRLVTTRAETGETLRREAVGEARTQFRSGEVIEVTLTVHSERAHEYMMLEDPLPAGCEILDRGSVPIWEWDWWWADQIPRDDLMAFALRDLPAGTRTLSYRMKAQVPGEYTAMPPTAWNMYDPRVRVTGAADEVVILP